jgi:hypothetical protein
MTEEGVVPTVAEHISSLTGGADSAPPPQEDPPAIDSLNEPVGIPTEMSPRYQQTEPPTPEPVEETPAEQSAPVEMTEDQRIAAGRLQEIVSMRKKLSQTQSSIETLRREMLDREARREQEEMPSEEEVYGEEIVNDPAVKYLTDRMEGIEARLDYDMQKKTEQQQQAAQAQAVNAEFADAVQKVQTLEKTFIESGHADYQGAYEMVRNNRRAMYSHLSPEDRERVVGAEEAQFVIQHLQNGMNPVEAVYNMALAQGWNPNSYQPPAVQQAPPAQQQPYQHPNTQKIQQGLSSKSLTSVGGNRGGTGFAGREISVENFENVPYAERMRILNDPDKFEALAKFGKTAVD